MTLVKEMVIKTLVSLVTKSRKREGTGDKVDRLEAHLCKLKVSICIVVGNKELPIPNRTLVKQKYHS